MRHASASIDVDLFRMGLEWEAIRAGEVPNMGPFRVARLLLSQPSGAECWKDIGGWNAQPDILTAAQQMIYVQAAIAHGQAGGSGKGPKEPRPPRSRVEERLRKKKEAVTFVEKATVWKERLDDPERRAEMERRLASWGDASRRTPGQELAAEQARRLGQWSPPGGDDGRPSVE